MSERDWLEIGLIGVAATFFGVLFLGAAWGLSLLFGEVAAFAIVFAVIIIGPFFVWAWKRWRRA